MNPTKKCPHCGAEEKPEVVMMTLYECGSTPKHRSPLCRERELRQKAEAELEKTRQERNRIGIDLRREYMAVWKKAEAENQKLRELLERALELADDHYPCEAAKIHAELNQLTK